MHLASQSTPSKVSNRDKNVLTTSTTDGDYSSKNLEISLKDKSEFGMYVATSKWLSKTSTYIILFNI